MILINVLALVALASAVLMLMVSSEDAALDRSIRFGEAARAAIIARAGEMSAVSALRRDAIEAPETDHLKEAWSQVIESEAAVEGGRFTLSISDAQALFNINNLGQAGLATGVPLRGLALAGIDEPTAARIAAFIQERGPLVRLSDLRQLGVEDAALAQIAALVTALPGATTVNVNTASPELLTLLTGSPAAARMLVAQRQRIGYLTQQDFSGLGLFLPPGVGFTSNHFWVRTRVTIGDTSQTVTSLLRREIRNGRPQVVSLGRWRGEAPTVASTLP